MAQTENPVEEGGHTGPTPTPDRADGDLQPLNAIAGALWPEQRVRRHDFDLETRLMISAGIVFTDPTSSTSDPGRTEDEARQIAFKRDVLGRDWRDPLFAACESLKRRRPTFSATWSFAPSRWRSRAGSVRRSADDVERVRLEFVFHP
jgi:hypothetical protein